MKESRTNVLPFAIGSGRGNVPRTLRAELPCPAVDEPSDEEILCFVDRLGGPKDRRSLAMRLLLHRYSLERAEILCDALGSDWTSLFPAFSVQPE